MYLHRAKLGQLLLKHGCITEEQLNAGLDYQRRRGGRLGDALVALGHCTEVDIARCWAEQMEIPFVDLEESPPTSRALRLVTRQAAVQYQAVPVRVEGERLLVAARNPFDLSVDEALRKMTGLGVVVGAAARSQLQHVLESYEFLQRSVPGGAAGRGPSARDLISNRLHQDKSAGVPAVSAFSPLGRGAIDPEASRRQALSPDALEPAPGVGRPYSQPDSPEPPPGPGRHYLQPNYQAPASPPREPSGPQFRLESGPRPERTPFGLMSAGGPTGFGSPSGPSDGEFAGGAQRSDPEYYAPGFGRPAARPGPNESYPASAPKRGHPTDHGANGYGACSPYAEPDEDRNGMRGDQSGNSGGHPGSANGFGSGGGPYVGRDPHPSGYQSGHHDPAASRPGHPGDFTQNHEERRPEPRNRSAGGWEPLPRPGASYPEPGGPGRSSYPGHRGSSSSYPEPFYGNQDHEAPPPGLGRGGFGSPTGRDSYPGHNDRNPYAGPNGRASYPGPSGRDSYPPSNGRDSYPRALNGGYGLGRDGYGGASYPGNPGASYPHGMMHPQDGNAGASWPGARGGPPQPAPAPSGGPPRPQPPLDEQAARDLAQMVGEAIRRGATDVHFEPGSSGLHIRCRIEGQVCPLRTVEDCDIAGYLEQSKLFFGLDTYLRGQAQEIDHSIALDGAQIGVRVTLLPVAGGELLSVRVMARDLPFLALDSLGLEEEVRAELLRVLAARRGMLAVGGLAGTGRTTTLFGLVDYVNDGFRRLVSVEDQLQIKAPGVHQVRVSESGGQAMAGLLRLVLQGEPDVVLIDELRDPETAELAVRAASTGRLILASIHATNSVSTPGRLMELGIPPGPLGAALSGILSQRLVRRVCDLCATDYPVRGELARQLSMRFGQIEGVRFRRGRGCSDCLYRGTRGRIGVFEFLPVDDDLRFLMGERVPPSAIHRHVESHMPLTLALDAFRKACRGEIPPEEILQLSGY